jgi:TM2 domain-containing membrane protein YozV
MGGNVVVSGRLGTDDFKAPDRPGMGFSEQMFGNGGGEELGGDKTTSFMSRQVRRELQEKTTWKSPAKAALLSGLLPGVGDFYVGKVSTGLVFYLVFYILLMLLILRGDLVIVAVLAVLALTSSGVSWLLANKHNETIHRIQAAPSLQRKTRETTFTFDRTRRRR